MESPLVATIDIGSQSLRVTLIDKKGNFLASHKHFYDKVFSFKNQVAECEGEQFLTAMYTSLKEISKTYPELVKRVSAISVASMRNTICFLKENTTEEGKKEYSLSYPIIHWLDPRRVDDKDIHYPFYISLMLKMVGIQKKIKRLSSLNRYLWLEKYKKEAYKNTDKVSFLSGFINYHLTGNLTETKATMVGHLPINYKKGVWCKKYSLNYAIFKVPISKLVDITEDCEPVGYLNRESAELSGFKEGLPVYCTGTDKSCEQVGQGAINEGDVSISLGTAAVIQMIGRKFITREFIVPSYKSVIPGLYTAEHQIFSGYYLLTWFKNEFAKEYLEKTKSDPDIDVDKELNKLLWDAPSCSNGLFMLPFWSEGITTVGMRGAFVGFTSSHTRSHVYRAIIEGINFELYKAYLSIKKIGKFKHPTRICIGGGGSLSVNICQMIANLFNLKVERSVTNESSSLGAAIAAFVFSGVYDSFDEAVKNMVRRKDVFIPDDLEHKKYLTFYNKIYKKAMNDIFKRCVKISRIYTEKYFIEEEKRSMNNE